MYTTTISHSRVAESRFARDLSLKSPLSGMQAPVSMPVQAVKASFVTARAESNRLTKEHFYGTEESDS